jgi:hypothetical protein
MPDLLTHMASGVVFGAILREPRYTAGVVVGTCLPDIVGRIPSYGFNFLSSVGVDVGVVVTSGIGFLHLPFGLLAVTLLVAQLGRAGERFRAWWPLATGCLLHLGLDAGQLHWGISTAWFFPFATWRWEAGLYGSEATVGYAPWLIVGALTFWRIRHADWPWRVKGASSEKGCG